jgi:hypothetical protein
MTLAVHGESNREAVLMIEEMSYMLETTPTASLSLTSK